MDIARALQQETGLPDLCLGGGVALNGVANARILAESGFERVFVPPAPGDAGCALGAALYCRPHSLRQSGSRCARSSVLGARGGWGSELARLAREDGQSVEELDGRRADRSGRRRARRRPHRRMDGRRLSSSVRARSATAAFSPRRMRPRCATGSIATSSTARSSGRSRRWCPSRRRIGISSCRRAARGSARFMSGVFPVRPEWRTRLRRSRTSTARRGCRTLERAMAPRLHALLEAYGRRTGIPVLLNTSFNVAGEPIVNRALEGYSTFRRCGIDVLVAGQDSGDEARQSHGKTPAT